MSGQNEEVQFTQIEQNELRRIAKKFREIRKFCSEEKWVEEASAAEWFDYLAHFKQIVGNFHNDISFLAELLAKQFLEGAYGRTPLDIGIKPQGAQGIDIETEISDGRRVACEIKTTVPYQPGFGAQQKAMIKKDLEKLGKSVADLKFMMVTDVEAFKALKRPSFANLLRNVTVVNLLTGETYNTGGEIEN